MKRFCIGRVWTDDTCLWIETKDGRRMCTPFSKWKRTKEPVPMIRKAYGIIKKYGQK